jgi:hypothetical protein
LSANNNGAYSGDEGKSDKDYYDGGVPRIVVSQFEDKKNQ